MQPAVPNVSLNLILDQVAKDKGVDRSVLVRTLEQAIHQAALKTFGLTRNIEASYNEEKGIVEVFQTLTVVENRSDNPDEAVNQIPIESARAKGIEAEAGDELLFQIFYRDEEAEEAQVQDERYGDILGLKTYRRGFGRIAAQTAKQVIIQRVRDAERENIHGEYKDRKAEIVTGIVRRFERGNLIVDLGRAEAVLPVREQIPREMYRPGDRIQAFVLDVLREAKGPQIILTRTANELLVKLFELEVPEIADKTVIIEAAAREPGSRAKIAVSSRDNDVDPVGACVGMKGSRVQAVVQELRGEKIDIVPWDDDPARFVCNALAPAEVSRVLVDDGTHTMEIIVPDDQLSLAIGRRGQNVRLASQLTGWKLEINSETKVKEMKQFAESSFAKLGLSSNAVDLLYGHGFRMARDLLDANHELLIQIPGINLDNVQDLINRAKAQSGTDATELARLEAEREAARLADARRHPSELTQTERLLRVRGLGERIIDSLAAAGYKTVEDIARETDLIKLGDATGLGVKKGKQLKHAVDQYMVEEAKLRADLDAERARQGLPPLSAPAAPAMVELAPSPAPAAS
jgi:N utilization substance protein A